VPIKAILDSSDFDDFHLVWSLNVCLLDVYAVHGMAISGPNHHTERTYFDGNGKKTVWDGEFCALGFGVVKCQESGKF